MRVELRRLKIYPGCVYRDVCLKIERHTDWATRFARLLGLVERAASTEAR